MRVAKWILMMLLLLALLVEVDKGSVKAAELTIYIRGDGSIDPPNVPIQRDGEAYLFLADIMGSIRVERCNVTIDGNGHMLQAGGMQKGGIVIRAGYLQGYGVKIVNLSVVGFEYGIWLGSGQHCTISGNNITNNGHGITLYFIGDLWPESGSWFNIIKDNNITNNFIGVEIALSSRNMIYHNNFVNNTVQVLYTHFGVGPSPNTWDNGYPSGGNYWSNYNATDISSGSNQDPPGSDGIADQPFTIINQDENLYQDLYPLTTPWVDPPPLLGDVNADGEVDILDITVIAKAFGSSNTSQGYSREYDLNEDGFIDIIDITIAANQFGKKYY
ncbi:MAG TPA: NosD domain-containing protein [Candidatus Bathyarchaeia archaeon]